MNIHSKIIILALLIIFSINTEQANAYTITGGNRDGRYETIHNIINLYPEIKTMIPDNLEFRLRYWGFPSAKTSIQSNGQITIDLDGTRYNPDFSRLVCHELGHAIQLNHEPEFSGAWLNLLTTRGYTYWVWNNASTYNPWEAWSENFARGLYWPYYSPRSTPNTNLVWLSRVETWEFLRKYENTK